ncbi:MAG: hypothetical protein EOO61_07430 [Hymenobacter sp.]|nr:MAG: hypothetical protein EOO61_07430 [Hymenobacter sp.]
MKPPTIYERVQQAEEVYQNFRKQYVTHDFTDWKATKELPSGEEVILSYNELIPPYCRRYPTMLGYIFSCIPPSEVAQVLDKHFPQPDRLDEDYIADTLQEIDDIVSSNYSFSPNRHDGIDYYNGFGGGLAMADASYAGIPTDNSRLMSKVLPNVERARQWMATIKEIKASSPPTPAPAELPMASTTATNSVASEASDSVGLKWLGKGADLAEVFYRMAKNGLIDLREFREPNGKNMSELCRNICELFQVPAGNRAAAAKALKASLSKFAPEELLPGPVDEGVIYRVLDRKPGGSTSTKAASSIPLPPVGEA